MTLLHISERLRKARGRVIQTIGALTQQVVGGGIQSIPEEQRSHINNSTTTGRVTSAKQGDELLHVLLKDVRVNDTVPRKHGTNEMPRTRPEFAIRGEDTVAQELLPLAVERLTLAIVGELAGQESFDILWVSGQDRACGDAGVQLSGFDICPATCSGDGRFPEFNIFICVIGQLALVDEVECFGGC